MSARLSSRSVSHRKEPIADEMPRPSDPTGGVVRARPGNSNDSALLSARDAAAFLGISVTSFRDHVAADLPRVHIGRRVLYDRGDLLRWIEVRKGISAAANAVCTTPSPRARQILAQLRGRWMRDGGQARVTAQGSPSSR